MAWVLVEIQFKETLKQSPKPISPWDQTLFKDFLKTVPQLEEEEEEEARELLLLPPFTQDHHYSLYREGLTQQEMLPISTDSQTRMPLENRDFQRSAGSR